MVDITFRIVEATDSAMLLSWRNDKESRENSINQSEVSQDDHSKWFIKMIGSPDNILLIALSSSVTSSLRRGHEEEKGVWPVGAFRMDKMTIDGVGDSPDTRLISYVVAPELRRRGLGRAIVAEGCARYGEEYTLIAKIRESNVASRKILEDCNFMFMGEIGQGLVAYVRPNDKQDHMQ